MNGTDTRQTRPWLLVSDIDDTLTGSSDALQRFSDAIERYNDRIWFAVNSSRPSGSVAETLKRVFPPGLKPDAVITALGTEISVAGAPVPDWDARFEGWPQERIFEIVSGFGHRPHAPEFQTLRKVSFAIPGEKAQAEVRQALAAADIRCRIIASGIDDFDIIPENAGKDAATLHLARTLGCDTAHVIVAGDSGNDLAMFNVVRKGIAVGNARQELLDGLEPGTFYHARHAHAAGVLEGLRHYGALPATDSEP
jgi:sucrose-6F-phosphate phosphohydrolase